MPWQPLFVYHFGEGANITNNSCSDGVQWIYKIFNDCVSGERGIASEVLGLASILTWMVVSVPQMIKNFRNIRGIEGISLMLILMWTLGDTANLVGGILTKQLPLQIYLAIYFVFADLVLFAQFLYYNLYWKNKYKDYEPIQSSIQTSGVPQVVLCISGALLLCIHKSLQVVDLTSTRIIRHPAGRSLMSHDLQYHIHIFNNIEDEVGYGIGIVSSVFYTFSRLGQMWKNYKRKSTDGLSVMMFILAVLGNLTYGLSILVRKPDTNYVDYVLKHLPWLIGSLGVIFLDSSLLVQFKYYGEKDDLDTLLTKTVPDNKDTDTEIYVNGQRERVGTIN
ncbi:lysosomal amino acid transporter 1 homolog [Mercenaria mercenaria]|uniref:lysosomal amino acid transporter 1 homolog n=1 Tax=Mercenaria mercenaria TaxID=6596 RepID=UPI00234F0A34|nr:lysosomal amino acid transporter 1 homolog [Mercenaria mercenaria]